MTGHKLTTEQLKQAKQAMLLKYSDREPKAFHQYDGFDLGESGGDYVMQPDVLGHCLMYRQNFELMRGAEVRVLIPPEVAKETALILLLKIAACLGREGGTDDYGNMLRRSIEDLNALHVVIDEVIKQIKVKEVELALDGY
jgi:hypothetical protein